MSKYALKLEQLVQTDQYGDILVTIQYDGQGPKLVTANGDNLDGDLKHSLDTVLGLVNFMLTKQIPTEEIAEQLEAEPQDGIHLPLNDLMMIVATSLREAPQGVQQIQPDILMEVMPEMIREFTENATGVVLPDSDGQPATVNNSQETPQQQDEPKEEKKDDNFFGGFGRR